MLLIVLLRVESWFVLILKLEFSVFLVFFEDHLLEGDFAEEVNKLFQGYRGLLQVVLAHFVKKVEDDLLELVSLNLEVVDFELPQSLWIEIGLLLLRVELVQVLKELKEPMHVDLEVFKLLQETAKYFLVLICFNLLQRIVHPLNEWFYQFFVELKKLLFHIQLLLLLLLVQRRVHLGLRAPLYHVVNRT